MREAETTAWRNLRGGLGGRQGWGPGAVYAQSHVPGQLGLQERERGQQLAHGAHRWRPSDERRRNLVKHLR